MAPGLEASWTQLDQETSLVSLTGELDLAGAERLEEPISRSLRDSSLIVDLSQLEFIDSAGLRVLVAAEREARSTRRGFAVIRSSAQAVMSVIELTKASTQIPLFPSLEAAQASL